MSQQINLYHPVFRKQEKKFSAKAMLQAGAAVMVMVVLLYGLLLWQVAHLRTAVKVAEGRQASLALRLNEIRGKLGPRAKSRILGDKLERLERLVAARHQIRKVLEESAFSNTRGYSGHLSALARQHLNGLWLTGFHIIGDGERMRIVGRSTLPELVPRYVQRLSGEAALEKMQFSVFRLQRPEPPSAAAGRYIDFEIKTAGAEDGEAEAEQP